MDGGIELSVKVVPGASRSELAGVLGNRLKVRVAAPAEGVKENRAVERLLKKWLGADEVEIVAGHRTATKTVRARGVIRVPETP